MTQPSTSAARRQTVSYLTRRFRQVGLVPNAKHGQNFLIDLNLLNILVDAAQLTPADVVLEIGTGMGSLTALLATRAAHVVTVELDEHLYQMAREELESFGNITMMRMDALKNKHCIQPAIVTTLEAHLQGRPDRTFRLVANLPYQIATPLIANLLVSALVPATMTVTIQKELADRIVAAPGGKEYGSLSVWVQSLCDVETLRVLPPTVFWPRPKVHSAIIHIRHCEKRRAAIPDIPYWLDFVRAMFFHRRKFLRAVAVSAFRKHLDKAAVDRVLQRFDWGQNVRTETLSVADLRALCEAFRSVAPDWRLG